jgi:hypothetical protein
MSSARKAGLLVATVVDWRAKRIEDPLNRLRYLRVATVGLESSGAFRRGRWQYAALAALVFAAASFAVSHAMAPRGAATIQVRRPSPVERTAVGVAPAERFPDVWLVEENGEREEYSNGLQIDCRLAVPNRPRSYAVFDATRPDRGPVEWRKDPVGIVFHTTESMQVPFEPLQNRALRHITGGLIEYVRDKRAYHFLVDRFGRVHSIVKEGDAANHAGHSVWADDKWLYLNLNDSFFGVSFEAQTHHGEGSTSITPAQARAGTLLVEMLRARYRLPAHNCVTHAQVSVNPDNMQIGYHTDWAANFPFSEVGLPDNYARPLPGLYLCGFVYDRSYVASTGQRILAAIELSEERLQQAAARRRTQAASYREYLQQEYRKNIRALKKETPQGDG